MEKSQEAIAEAKKRLLIADHMTSFTYPLVNNDDRLLVPIAENIFLALTSVLAALLYYERALKRIPPFHDTFDSKYYLFAEEVSEKHNLTPKYKGLLMEIRALLLAHRESPVEFSRNKKLVMCTDNYKDVKTISIDKIKNYLVLAKQFFDDVEKIMCENAKISVGSKRRT